MKAQNMSPLVSANPLGTFDFPFKTLIRSDAAFGFPRVRSKKPCSIKSDIRFVCASSKSPPSENSNEIGADEVSPLPLRLCDLSVIDSISSAHLIGSSAGF
ncbi:hypothetical protein QJS04_geneDACA003471 [Acorus gramineus]|uniref:Uncharacterized protein n=1 Tax=Acorus gramineus TaxID=55184 RepID=A0AAV9BT62_ACOGR|nr:hypothetical protein QJS04_geneDACA003471 [Acorus gramineus]